MIMNNAQKPGSCSNFPLQQTENLISSTAHNTIMRTTLLLRFLAIFSLQGISAAIPAVQTITIPAVNYANGTVSTSYATITESYAQGAPYSNFSSSTTKQSLTSASSDTLATVISTVIVNVTVTASNTAAATTSSGSSSTATTTAASQTPTSAKRGLLFNAVNATQVFPGAGTNDSKISWSYNWNSSPFGPNAPMKTKISAYNSALHYVPMLWSNASALTEAWNSDVNMCLQMHGTDALLAFNEPDNCQANTGGSCMTIDSAVTAYKTYMEPFGNMTRLGAPAATSAVGPNLGLNWTTSFLSACSGCQVDFIPVHWYASAYAISYFQEFVQQAYNVTGKPIWVTEFGFTNDGAPTSQQATFLETVLQWLDVQPYVERYAFFMDGPGYLLTSAGTDLSSLGEIYNNV